MAARRKKIEVTKYQWEALQFLRPPEQLTVSEWAEKYRMLDSKSSAMPGPWSNDITPYLTGVMDEFNNYETEKIIFVKPTQIGGTEALQNMIGYIVMQDPSPTMIVYPTDTLAKSVSENRLQPMLKATPEIAKKFDENSSLLELQFDSMYISLTGSNSPSGLASKPIRFLMMDEVDKYPGASSKEADPIKLATERTKTFHNKKIYITSTPTLKTGHIWKEKEAADIEKHFFVPCPHCGEYIEFKFQNIRFPDDEGMSYADRAEFATYVCQECGCLITDNDKHNMLKLGEWRTVRHNTKYVRNVAFWINTLYSPFVRWSDIAKEFLVSKDDPEDLQNFVNSWLAEAWEDTKLKTSAELDGNRNIVATQCVETADFGSYDGKYYVDSVKHTIGSNGYRTQLTLHKVQTPIKVTAPVVAASGGKTYTVVSGDTLWGISKKFYGTGTKYSVIYNANADLIEATAKSHGKKSSSNGHWIWPGETLTIPEG